MQTRREFRSLNNKLTSERNGIVRSPLNSELESDLKELEDRVGTITRP